LARRKLLTDGHGRALSGRKKAYERYAKRTGAKPRESLFQYNLSHFSFRQVS
jgi:hypothetical protein